MAATTLKDKLMARISIGTNGCWLWTGRVHKDGYGKWKEGDKELLAHRAMYELLRGEIPSGKEIDHLCKERRCVNPDHLEPVKHHENIRRGRSGAYNLEKTHCPKGHPYTGKNLILRGTQGGKRTTGRICRVCTKLWNDASAAKRKERAISR